MSTIDSLIDDLITKEYSISDTIIPPNLTQLLYQEGHALWESGDYRSARIGKGVDEQKRTEIRSDKIHWLEPSELTEAQQTYWNFIDELKMEVNRTFYFGLQDFEAHFAVYPEGSFYKKHLDQFAKTPHRQAVN